MAKFRKKRGVVEAVQWNKIGDAPDVVRWSDVTKIPLICPLCFNPAKSHGALSTPEAGYSLVCPGDWIVKDETGKQFVCKPAVFDATYEPAE